jgi:hypothetical protein
VGAQTAWEIQINGRIFESLVSGNLPCAISCGPRLGLSIWWRAPSGPLIGKRKESESITDWISGVEQAHKLKIHFKPRQMRQKFAKNSVVVLCNTGARQSLVVIYSRERRSVRSPLKAEG